MTLEALPETLEPSSDEYTNKWYRDYFRSICFRIVNAEKHLADWIFQVKMLRKQCGELGAAREQDAARIGRLVSENEELGNCVKAIENQLAEVVARLDRQGEFLGQLKKTK